MSTLSINRTLKLGLGITLALGLASIAQAGGTPHYTSTQVLVPPDQFALGGNQQGLTPAPVYKPHDSRTSFSPDWTAVSDERTGCAGITTLRYGSNNTLKYVNIDEPGVEFHGGEEAAMPPCVGSIFVPPGGVEPPEGTPAASAPDEQFPASQRFNPSVCLPVVLPPGQNFVRFSELQTDGTTAKGKVKSPGPGLVCAPLGAERHARHPHGITIDWVRNVAYQVIEHSGLRWNANRTAFQVADTTDEESGLTLAWDVTDEKNPKILKAYLNGHAAHEITVNQRNGLVFQGNHEDSHGVTPSIWVDVINTSKANPYGFIDTGYFNAIQGIDVDEATNEVRGTTHVGEKVFAFDGSCVPTANPPGVIPPPAPPGYSLPAGDNGMKMGWNCIKWWADIRPAFVAAYPDLSGIFAPDPTVPGALPLVLHQHNLVVDDLHHRSYSSIHSIHDAEHTGLSDDEPPAGTDEESGAVEHYMARFVAEVDTPSAVNPTTKKATVPVHMIDLSHGFNILAYPNVDSIPGNLAALENSFIHAHFLWVDPIRDALLVSGEHTGNLAVVDTDSRTLKQVIPITKAVPNCTAPIDPVTGLPVVEEPHVHGVYIQPLTGTVYVTDEGEHCFYESVTVLKPN